MSTPSQALQTEAPDSGAVGLRAGPGRGESRGPLPRWTLGVAFLLAYVLADALTLFPHPRFNVQPWNLHPALGVTLFALADGPALVPVVLVAVYAAWWILPGAGADVESVFAAIGITGTYWVAGRSLHRWTRWGAAEVRPRDVHVLLAVCGAAALLGALIEALRQAAATGLAAQDLPLLTWRLFVADLLGLVVLAPALLQWAGGGARRALAGRRPTVLLRDGVLLVLVLGGLLELVFGWQPLDQFRMSYLLFLPMIAVAMRYGLVGVATTVPVVQLGLLGALTLIGTRPGTAFEFQLLMLTLAVSVLYLGALSDERQRAAARIAEHERALRERGHALAEAQRIASTAELAAAMAHDLGQPLSALGTYARASQVLAARGVAEQAKLAETLEQIVQESARAGHYLRRMREFFRTGAMRQERVNVRSLIDATHAFVRDRLVLASIQWSVRLEPGLPDLHADAVQVGAVLGNLVANACDALEGIPGWRQVHVRAQCVPGSDRAMVRIRVEDLSLIHI